MIKKFISVHFAIFISNLCLYIFASSLLFALPWPCKSVMIEENNFGLCHEKLHSNVTAMENIVVSSKLECFLRYLLLYIDMISLNFIPCHILKTQSQENLNVDWSQKYVILLPSK